MLRQGLARTAQPVSALLSMERLDYETFLARAEEFEKAVAATPEIPTFCSGLDWLAAAHEGLHGLEEAGEYLILRDGEHWVVLQQRNPPVFYPLETAWMFGCPLLGGPEGAVALLRRAAVEILPGPAGFVISGVRRDGLLHRELRGIEPETLQYEEFETVDCMLIDLGGGVEDWLGRRSKRFRKSMDGLTLPPGCSLEDGRELAPEEMMRRILAIQRDSYKWKSGADIFQQPEYSAFYEHLVASLCRRGRARLLFVRNGERDLAYILGGVGGSVYRGLQMSYREEAKSHGLGNFLQLANLRRMEEEGVTEYDLGMHAPYKERWTDRCEEYLGVFAVLR